MTERSTSVHQCCSAVLNTSRGLCNCINYNEYENGGPDCVAPEHGASLPQVTQGQTQYRKATVMNRSMHKQIKVKYFSISMAYLGKLKANTYWCSEL